MNLYLVNKYITINLDRVEALSVSDFYEDMVLDIHMMGGSCHHVVADEKFIMILKKQIDNHY